MSQDAASVVVAKAPAQQINDWARQRGWSKIDLISSESNSYLVNYKCQSGETDDTLQPVMHVFTKQGDGIYHFWGTELS